MRTVYFVASQRMGDPCCPRCYFDTEKEAQAKADEYTAKSGKDFVVSPIQLKQGQSCYAVYINSTDFISDFYAIHVTASSEADARRQGNEYIRDWDIMDQRIQKIQKLI